MMYQFSESGAVDDLLLADATSMGTVTLHVRDLAGMTTYYREALALTVLSETADSSGTVLGREGTPLLVLHHEPDLPVAAPGHAGLFHTALLFEDEASLAATVVSAGRHPASRFVGSADHVVSNAFYFTDPEGNGIELYWDRPRSAWRSPDGSLRMASLPLDPQGFLERHLTEVALDGVEQHPGRVGHVHLKVGDLAAARAFYVDTLGFEQTYEMPGALFVSAGGYHHHMGMNTWASLGAGPRAATLGLGQVTITVPGREDVEALANRLRHASVPVRDDGATLRFEDPWSSLIEVSATT